MPTAADIIIDPDNDTGTDYTSMSACEAGRQQNYVTNDVQDNWWCRSSAGTADTTACTIAGSTTDATRFIWVRPYAGQEHSGVWNDSIYRLSLSTASVPLALVQEHTRFFGLQLIGPAGSKPSVFDIFRTAIIDSCIVRRTGGGSSNFMRTAGVPSGGTVVIRNTLAYGQATQGINLAVASGSNAVIYLHNNHFISTNSNTNGLSVANATVVAINNIVAGWSESFLGTFAAGTDYNASDINDTPGVGSNNLVNQTFPFVGGGDYSLTSQLAGLDLSGDFTTDILGVTRSAWTRGAFEFVESTAAPQAIWFM